MEELSIALGEGKVHRPWGGEGRAAAIEDPAGMRAAGCQGRGGGIRSPEKKTSRGGERKPVISPKIHGDINEGEEIGSRSRKFKVLPGEGRSR